MLPWGYFSEHIVGIVDVDFRVAWMAAVAADLSAYMDLTYEIHMLVTTLEKSYLFHITSDKYDLYMKIVTLDEIYNFFVFIFFFIWDR